jgi:prepilin-type N-terminal cleavage/methylation domain-containing protein
MIRARTRGPRIGSSRSGFTLAEVAVTILIVGIGLLFILQGLNTAKMTAAQTRNIKLSRELALFTLGQVESGLFQDDIENGLTGSYADQGYPEFSYEVAVGDQTFVERDTANAPHDSWAKTPEQKKKDEESDVQEPFEKVKIRITFPKFVEYENEKVYERWIPWEQVYGSEDTKSKSTKAVTSGSGSAPGSTPAGKAK